MEGERGNRVLKFLLIMDENGKDKLYYKPYTEDYLKKSLKMFSELIISLTELLVKLKNDLPLELR